MRRFLFLCLVSAAFQGAAWAADNGPIVPQVPPLVGPSGYVDLRVGYGWGNEDGTFDDGAFSHEESWNEAVFGGAGRGVISLSPNLSLQARCLDEYLYWDFQRRGYGGWPLRV